MFQVGNICYGSSGQKIEQKHLLQLKYVSKRQTEFNSAFIYHQQERAARKGLFEMQKKTNILYSAVI